MEGMGEISPSTQETLSLKDAKNRAINEIKQRESALGKDVARRKFGEKMGSKEAGAAAALEEASILTNENVISRLMINGIVGSVHLTDKTYVNAFNYPSEMHSYGIEVEGTEQLWTVTVGIGRSFIEPRKRDDESKWTVQETSFEFYSTGIKELLAREDLNDQTRAELKEELDRLSKLSPRDIGQKFKRTIEDKVKRFRKYQDKNIRL